MKGDEVQGKAVVPNHDVRLLRKEVGSASVKGCAHFRSSLFFDIYTQSKVSKTTSKSWEIKVSFGNKAFPRRAEPNDHFP